MKEDKYMSFERKLLRNQIRANRGNKNTPFNILWLRMQIKRYGYKKALALKAIGKGLATLTNQIKMTAYGK